MKLDITKLLYKPKYFQENPLTLLHFTMREWNGQLYPLNRDAILHMRRIYTNCHCTSDKLVWQNTVVENQEIEIIACNDCFKWSLIISGKKDEKDEFKNRENLCHEVSNMNEDLHSLFRGQQGEKASTEGTIPIARDGFRPIIDLLLENSSFRKVSMYALFTYSFLWAPTLFMELLKIR